MIVILIVVFIFYVCLLIFLVCICDQLSLVRFVGFVVKGLFYFFLIAEEVNIFYNYIV